MNKVTRVGWVCVSSPGRWIIGTLRGVVSFLPSSDLSVWRTVFHDSGHLVWLLTIESQSVLSGMYPTALGSRWKTSCSFGFRKQEMFDETHQKMCKVFLNVNMIGDWFIIVLNAIIKTQIGSPLWILSHLNEREQISLLKIFSLPCVLSFGLRSIWNHFWFFFLDWGSEENMRYYLICTQMPPVLINKNDYVITFYWHLLFTCSRWASNPCEALLHKIFLRVPEEVLHLLSSWSIQTRAQAYADSFPVSWHDMLWWCPPPPPWAQPML